MFFGFRVRYEDCAQQDAVSLDARRRLPAGSVDAERGHRAGKTRARRGHRGRNTQVRRGQDAGRRSAKLFLGSTVYVTFMNASSNQFDDISVACRIHVL